MLKSRIAILSGALLLISSAVAETLIKESEAQLPVSPVTSLELRAITRGPGIRILSPDMASQKVTSPFPLRIAFEPHGGARIDLATVKVTYLRSSGIELLDRVRNGLSEKGIDIAAAEVPPGEHQIRISVQDSEGRQSNTMLYLNVAK
jgi:hypothetical protein